MTTSIHDKIAALLRKAESTDSPEEAQLFTAKAEELMIKYSIDSIREEVQADSFSEINVHSFKLQITEVFARALVTNLHNGVVQALGTCRLLWNPVEGTKAFLIIGADRDVELAMKLIESLMMQALEAMKRWYTLEVIPTRGKLPRAEERVAKRQFLISFSTAAVSRLRQKLSDSQGTSTELVLAGQGERVEAFMESTLNIRKGRTRPQRSSLLGREEGRAAGMRADLGNQLS